MSKARLLLASATLALAGASQAATTAPLLPVQDFVKHPSYSAVKISPDGRYLAITVDQGEQDNLVVLRTDTLKPVKVNILPDKKSVGGFYWTSPERLMFTAVKKVGSFERPFGTGEWYAVNADGSQPRTLIDYGTVGASQRGMAVGNEVFSLLDTLKDDDTNVIMQVRYPRSRDGAGAELVQMDTLSGRRKSLGRAPKPNCGLALDKDKQPRFAVCSDDTDAEGRYDSQSELYRRENDGRWTLVNASKSHGRNLTVERSAANGTVYAYQDDGKTPAALGVLDTSTGEFKSLFQDPVAEIASLINAVDGSEAILGVMTMAGAPKVALLDDAGPDADLYASLAGAFPGQLVNFSSATRDGAQIIVSVSSDSNPGELYLYDRKSGKARFLMKRAPWLDASQMASVKPIAFTARDGLKVHGYLTVPKGSDGRNLPMIVNVHGGPMGPRDDWGFDTTSQLFANRGYAVLQLNYRGSGGFGKAFQDKAYGQWSEGIMNDILDGTRYVIDQGWADKDRVCIFGGSFGGYASLMAPVRDPGMFKCAFGYVGMYDASIQMKLSDTSKSESGKRYLLRAFGSTPAEQQAMSPISHVAQLKLPIYLAAGARDARCPPEHTEAMNKALIAAGNPPEGMIIQSGEGHGYYKEENNLNLFTKMLSFFEKHIGSGR